MKRMDKGFSFIELMVAIVILSVGLLGLAGLQATAIKGNAHGNAISQATALAENTIEEIRNTSYEDITYGTEFPMLETSVDGSSFDRAILIEEDEPLNELKRITVTVSWRDLNKHQVVLRTIASDED